MSGNYRLSVIVPVYNEEQAVETAINDLLLNHSRYTASPLAKKILANFRKSMPRFIKVMPLEYKRVLGHAKISAKEDLAEVSDG